MKLTIAFCALTLGVMSGQLTGQVSYPPSVTPADVSVAVQNQIQSASAVTDANGAWTITWPAAFSGVPTTVDATIRSGSATYLCVASSATATTATGRCSQVVSNTLPTAAPALLGLVISPLSNPGAGLTVTVFGKM